MVDEIHFDGGKDLQQVTNGDRRCHSRGKGADSELPKGCRWAPLKTLYVEDGECADGITTFPKRSVMRWRERDKLRTMRPTPGRVLVAVQADGTPAWKGERPKSVRPGRELRKRQRPGDAARRQMLSEYRLLREKLETPQLLRPVREPNGWRLRHEYLRRLLERPASERLLPIRHASWPESATGEGGVRYLNSGPWLASLRAMLQADGEQVPEPGVPSWG